MFKKAHNSSYERVKDKDFQQKRAAFKNLNPEFNKIQIQKIVEFERNEVGTEDDKIRKLHTPKSGK
jgi:hypothetical protein